MDMQVITLSNMTVTRGEKTLFRGLNYHCKTSGLTVIRGRNGVGKTTLLHVMAGLHRAYSGQISAIPPSELVYLTHQNALYPDYTVAEQLRLWGQAFGVTETLDAAAHYFALNDRLDVPIQTLSAGWQKRVALAKLMIDPTRSVWLLDEPFANLDAAGKDMLTKLIAVRADQGGTVVLSAHDEVELPFGDVLDLDNYAGGVDEI